MAVTTKPALRKEYLIASKLVAKGRPGQWSAKNLHQMMAKAYKAAGGGYRN